MLSSNINVRRTANQSLITDLANLHDTQQMLKNQLCKGDISTCHYTVFIPFHGVSHMTQQDGMKNSKINDEIYYLYNISSG
jgi:hypothetical protein